MFFFSLFDQNQKFLNNQTTRYHLGEVTNLVETIITKRVGLPLQNDAVPH